MAKSRRRSTRDRFNRILTSGSIGGIAGLGAAVAILVLVGAAIASLLHIHAGEDDLSLFDAVWEILQRAIDPGQLDGELRWSSRILLLTITGIGILLISTLISIVNSTLERRIEKLRRGRGPVEASNHIVILGWSDTGVKVTEELAEALQDAGEFEVVVLSDQDPIQVATEIRDDIVRRHPDWRHDRHIKHIESWLTVRRGNITSVNDLAILARLATAKSVIVLGDTHSDAETTKIILAIAASIQTDSIHRTSPVHIIATLQDNNFARKLRDRLQLLSDESANSGEPIAALIPIIPAMLRTGIEAQVARHRGLSEAYRDLLDFDGDELYLIHPPTGVLTYGEIALCGSVVVIGIIRDGEVDLWPTWESPVEDAELIVLASSLADGKRAVGLQRAAPLEGERPQGRMVGMKPVSFLVIGWNSFANELTKRILSLSPEGSMITVLAHSDDLSGFTDLEKPSAIIVKVRESGKDPLDDPTFIASFDHVIAVSHDELGPAESDAMVLTDVLACRVLLNSTTLNKEQPTTVVAELRQTVNKNIAGVRLADDLLLSDSLSASAMAHLAVHPHMAPVLETILGATSPSDVQLVGISGESVNLVGKQWSVARRELAQATGELAVALRTRGTDGHVLVNPPVTRVIGQGEDMIVLSRYAISST